MYSSPVINAALGLPVDTLKNLRVQGKLRGGVLHGRALFYSVEEVLLLGLALRLSRLIGQDAGFGLVFDDPDFGDELQAAIEDGMPLVLVHAHPARIVFGDAGDVVRTTDEMVTVLHVAEMGRALLIRLEDARRAEAAKTRPPHERIERHASRERRDMNRRWQEYERGSVKGRRKA